MYLLLFSLFLKFISPDINQIEKLDNPDWKIRENATKTLESRGFKALPALVIYYKSESPEAHYRMQYLLNERYFYVMSNFKVKDSNDDNETHEDE